MFFLLIKRLSQKKKKNNESINSVNSNSNHKSNKNKNKKYEAKDKIRFRKKPMGKGAGYIKSEFKFDVPKNEDKKEEKKDSTYLNYGELGNLQDIINFAASMKVGDDGITPIESLYEKALSSNYDSNIQYTNEKINYSIAELLKDKTMDEHKKMEDILDFYSKLLRMKNRNLEQSTYIGLVELFIKNGYLNHASYFLCQMDRLKMDIPRILLEYFLRYSAKNTIFLSKGKKETNKVGHKDNTFNKFDEFCGFPSEPEYAYYFSKKNNYRTKDMSDILSELKIDSKPYYPKKVIEEKLGSIKNQLDEVNLEELDDYHPNKED
ncbi:MAG: hypothetical protein MJ252_14445 [archaeon]|nr:hypothetical protein [archaeon]